MCKSLQDLGPSSSSGGTRDACNKGIRLKNEYKCKKDTVVITYCIFNYAAGRQVDEQLSSQCSAAVMVTKRLLCLHIYCHSPSRFL